jgi:hypothetical protein
MRELEVVGKVGVSPFWGTEGRRFCLGFLVMGRVDSGEEV